MKKDIAEYLVDSFIDFKGEKHDVVLCALSSSPMNSDYDSLSIAWVCECDDIEKVDTVYRMLSIGISICNPVDEFDVELGKKIAYNKALNSEPKLYSSTPGVINTPLVRAFLHQEMEHIKKYPGKFIKGYDDAHARYNANKKLEIDVAELNNSEAEVVQAIMDGVDIDKCTRIATKLKNAKNI